MHDRVAELCRRLAPLVPLHTRRLWAAYRAEHDSAARSQIEHTIDMLAAKHLGLSFEHDRSPFPPPNKNWAEREGLPVGDVLYANKRYCGFNLELDRIKEHALVCGRSGSGKSTLTLHLARGLMSRGVIVTAFDWKRSYRDLLLDVPPGQLRVRTPGRDLAPLFWNPLIPPPGTDPVLYAKLIVDVICRALLGGDGVISLLHRGILALYDRMGVGTHQQERWPTIPDLLDWLDNTKLTGRAAMWKSSADRILRAMTYGGFGRMIDTQTNADLLALLEHHHVLELDGLAGSADRSIFAEGVTLWLYRYLLHQGERKHLERVWIHEEAHHLFKSGENGAAQESVLEQSLRMARAYGVGYIVVDQQASLLSKTVFANTGTIFAMNQKTRSDIQAIAGAINLDDTQRQAVSTLPIGHAIARVPDGHPEPFLIRVPAPIDQDHISDEQVRLQAVSNTASPQSIEDEIVQLMRRSDPTDSVPIQPSPAEKPDLSPVPSLEKKKIIQANPSASPVLSDISKTNQKVEQPSPEPSQSDPEDESTHSSIAHPPTDQDRQVIDSQMYRFLADLISHPLSTTVHRYERLHLSRRKGHALRTRVVEADLARPVRLPTRSGNVVLLELTPRGRQACQANGIEAGPSGSGGIEHRYWVDRVARSLRDDGYQVRREMQLDGNGRLDLLATNGKDTVACEIETGSSNIRQNLSKAEGPFDRLLIIATNSVAAVRCRKMIDELGAVQRKRVQLQTWLDY
jgi:energy-coupling factor transporter ATP-binding protein EcfA2